MKPYHQQLAFESHRQPAQTGFTLIEVLVGLVIGMLATLVIMQVFSVFENQKRTTTGVSDTLTNGNISLYKLTRDMQQAAWTLESLSTGGTAAAFSPLKCAEPITIDPAFPPGTVTGLTPVTITDGGGGLSDSITIRYGSSDQGGVPTPITASAGNNVTINSTLGCEPTPGIPLAGNIVTLAINGTACTVSRLTAPTIKSAFTSAATVPTTGVVTVGDFSNAVVGGTLSCLGSWHEVTYAVNQLTSVLQRQDVGAVAAKSLVEPIVTDVVNIQAQYGISAPGLSAGAPDFNVITQWVDATPLTGFAVPTVDDRNRIKAIRLAIVTRDPKRNTGYVTDPCDPIAHTGLCAWPDAPGSPAPTIDLTGTADWRNYRYRVFEVVIPIRNVIWSADYICTTC